jgi:ketosteroid isomerase-like protein
MTSNAARAATLVRALRASIEGNRSAIAELYTDDVKAWTPALSAASATELAAEFERRDDAFSGIELDVSPLDVGGDYACAEWSVSMTHSGKLALANDVVIEPTGVRVTLNGATVAEFRGSRICALRQYWDEFSVLEQLGVLANDDA